MRNPSSLLAALAVVLGAVHEARAEPARGPASAVTGLELHLAQPGPAYLGRTLRIRGTAYQVVGLAGLRPLEGARVRARCGGEWAEGPSGDGGSFVLEVSVPESPVFRSLGSPVVEVELESAEESRAEEISVSLVSPVGLEARTDRELYQPGETVRLWVRVFDVRTGRPLASEPVRIERGGRRVVLVSSSAGVVSHELPLGGSEEAGPRGLVVTAGRGRLATSREAGFRVGARPSTALFVTAEASPGTVGPGEAVTVRVRVRSPTGFPVRAASVSLRLGAEVHVRPTDDDGLAGFELRAPEYGESQGGWVPLEGEAHHAGRGRAGFRGGFRVRPPSSFEVDLVGVPIAGVRGRLILSIADGSGAPPPAGTEVVVAGPAVPSGRVTLATDRHGLAALPVRPDPGSYARHVGGSECSGSLATSLDVQVQADPPQVTRRCVHVLDGPLVVPTVRRPAVAPGETVVVELERHGRAARSRVVVELVAAAPSTGADEVVAVATAGAGAATVRLVVPPDRLGIFRVRARPVLEQDSVEGPVAVDGLLVRPRVLSYPRLEVDREVYPIRGTARLTIDSPPGAPASWVAVLARDLAQHQGERPFAQHFLQGALERAVLEPTTPDADLLVRAALASHLAEGSSDEPARDPFPLAAELRESATAWMLSLEQALEEATANGTVDELTTGAGRARAFVEDALELVAEEPAETLGGGPATIDMLDEVDPAFTFEAAARRVSRARLVRLLGVLASFVDPDGQGELRERRRSVEPPERWLSELVRLGVVQPTDLHDPWGGTFALRRTGRAPVITIAVEAEGYELLSPGPDGRIGTADDVRDPFARILPEGSPYARASGEDALMAALSALAPAAAVLDDLLAAYRRLNEEALEELLGDAVGASFGYGGLGMGGSGSGYGRGGGAFSSRSAGVPGFGVAIAALAAIVREDFPATLFFEPEAAVEASGRTSIEIRLAEAPTTYLVEAILWREDGWIASGSTRIQVDQDLVVDARVPPAAQVGDEIVLPVRLANRTETARRIRLRVSGDGRLGVRPAEVGPVEVPPRDAVDVPVPLFPSRRGEGTVTVEALSEQGEPLDAVRRRMTVAEPGRRASDRAEVVVHGRGTLRLEVPAGASPEGESGVRVALGPAVFATAGTPGTRLWVEALLGRGGEQAVLGRDALLELRDSEAPPLLARLVGSHWSNARVPDELFDRPLEVLADSVEGIEAADYGSVHLLSRLLMLLAPAEVRARARPARRRALAALVGQLRDRVESGAALFADAPWLSARAAAALVWTAPAAEPGARALELLDRARGRVVVVDRDRWLEAGRDDAGEALFVATGLLALSEARRGRREEAFGLVRSLAALAGTGGGPLPELSGLSAEDWTMAAAAAAALGRDASPAEVLLRVDGEDHRVPVVEGLAALPLRRLGSGGVHEVELVDAGGEVALISASAGYRVDWSTPPPLVGPYAVEIVGSPGHADGRSGLTLVVRNRVPRTIPGTVVQIGLPAGAEVDQEALARIRGRASGPPEVSTTTLTLRLGPLAPRGEARVDLPWVWTVPGRLRGLGVQAHSTDRPEAISIAPAAVVDVAPRGSQPEVGR